jgi:RNA polymerase sigma-70 factor (ECF subfamily)
MAGERSDLELVRQAQRAGGEASFAELVERYQRPLYNFLLRSLRDAAVSEELFQEAFLRAFGGLDGFDSQDPAANVRAWLYRIALHLVRDEHRRRAVRA